MNKFLLVFAVLALLCAPVLVVAEEASATPSASPSPEASPSVEPSVEPSVSPSANASVAPSASPSVQPSANASAEPRGKAWGQVKKEAREEVGEALKGARGLVRAKWFKWRFVFAHAAGIAATSDAGEYHSFSMHGRIVRYIPYETIQSLKGNASNASNSSNSTNDSKPCQTESCIDAYGVEKAIGVMRFGAVRNAGGETYWFVGDWSGAAKTLTADVYVPSYPFSCLINSTSCNATKIGSLTASLKEDFEGFKHLVVGKASFSGGAYAGKSFNVFAWGWANPRLMRIQTQAQLVNA